MATTPFVKKLVEVTQLQQVTYKNMDEAESKLCNQIKKYWIETGFQFTSCVSVAWSAVFVSWCIKQAGATSTEFKFAQSHSMFVYKAISNTFQKVGVFEGRKITEYKPKIGDILHNNRRGNSYTYDFAAKNDSYESHSAIIVEVGEDSKGKYILTIGGNEGDSIRIKEIRLDVSGFVKQRKNNPFICIIENLK
ncbi:DUF2272 domain-containing protein [Pedobacter sp. Leaf170]|uniref:DUF2272 domain-containing protein n=1 Tax=Pedobacter sp. Leaf170 TaxID=2876558 RepID=UPI001E3AAE4D|nr:DUF2272 domain-containing protein [Pedobacter sp. Leaf170]